MQLIKGGFSRKLQSKFPVWQRSFTDHRIRDRADWDSHIDYINHNPVRAGLCQMPEDSGIPRRIAKRTSAAKAALQETVFGTAEAVPISVSCLSSRGLI
jgi:hypothetical protein